MIAAALLSESTQTLGALILIPALFFALRQAPWIELFSDFRRQHLLFGTTLGLFLLWMVRKDFSTGLSYHFIGMTAVTLLLDWPLAILAGLLNQLLLVITGHQEWQALGINFLLLVLIPVSVTNGFSVIVEKLQPRNLFVYIFCSCFFPAALAVLVSIIAGLGVLIFDGLFIMPLWIDDFIGYLFLIMFPEAFINGMIITGLVVFCPEWLETFNRTRYLQAPWKDKSEY